MEHSSEQMSAFLRRSLKLHRLLSLFRDIRRDLVIPLKNLPGMIFCMPIFGQSSMLVADRDACRKRTRLLFNAKHRCDHLKMFSSDTTRSRCCGGLIRSTPVRWCSS